MTESGRTPSQIRDDIIRGAWRLVNLENVQ